MYICTYLSPYIFRLQSDLCGPRYTLRSTLKDIVGAGKHLLMTMLVINAAAGQLGVSSIGHIDDFYDLQKFYIYFVPQFNSCLQST